jgi:hypothetical protein
VAREPKTVGGERLGLFNAQGKNVEVTTREDRQRHRREQGIGRRRGARPREQGGGEVRFVFSRFINIVY